MRPPALAGSRPPRLALLAALPFVALLSCPGGGSATGGTSAQPDPVQSHLAGPAVRLRDGGPDALNIVILGDGFTQDATSLNAYRAAAEAVASRLLASPPFGALAEAITIIRVDVVSDEAGIDVPATCGGASYNPASNPPFAWARSEKHPANFLETSWCAGAAVSGAAEKFFLNSSSPNVALAALSSGVVPDVTIVLANDWMFGATAWPDSGVVFVSIGQNLVGDINPRTGLYLQPNDPCAFPDVVVHEVGHLAPFLLLDEYEKGEQESDLTPEQKAVIDASPNLTTDSSSLPWQHLVAPATPIPTNCRVSQPDAGAVPGGYWFVSGVFHAACRCGMNETPDAPFCVVCRERIVQTLAGHLPQTQTAARQTQRAAWIVLDGLRIESPGDRYYGIDYTITTATQTVTGAWPPARPARFTGPAGRVIGVLAARIAIEDAPAPGHAPAAPWLRVNYRLKRWTQSDGSDTPVVVADVTVPVSAPVPPGPRGWMLALNEPTHRLTVGVAVR